MTGTLASVAASPALVAMNVWLMASLALLIYALAAVVSARMPRRLIALLAVLGAAELLFSWIVEPELWEYVPFIADPKGAVGRDVLAKSAEECARAGCRLAPADFDAL